MGTVYAAHDQATGELFAIKILTAATEGHRLRQEFRAAVDLHHRNIVRLYELGWSSGRPYLVMELVDGADIVTAIRRDVEKGRISTSGHERLRALLGQLAEALHFLHTCDRVHGDVKASNVLVTPEDRVVLVDFGLSRDLVDRSLEGTSVRSSTSGGTPSYSAPEGTLAPARDWYAFGVLLYLAVHGELPAVVGPDAWHPRGDDDDLADLFRCLTALDPSRRPEGAEVMARLGRGLPRTVEQPGEELVGRTDELAQMQHALASHAADPFVLTVSGVSGVGKTALVRALLRNLHGAKGYAVLAARCHEREAVRYMGLDALMTALVRHLGRLPSQVVPYLIPRHIRVLAQLFPRLFELPAVADAPTSTPLRDPQEVLRCASIALKELLCRLADRGPVAIWLDDLQWIDADSVIVLGEVLRGPEPPRAVFVFSYRSEDPGGFRRLQALFHTASPELARMSVELAPLSHDDAAALARGVLCTESLLTPARKRVNSPARVGRGAAGVTEALASGVGRGGAWRGVRPPSCGRTHRRARRSRRDDRVGRRG
jgi:serine/threonine protein kinase